VYGESAYSIDQFLWVELEEFCSYEGQEMQIKEKIVALKI
jgi:hypothetical protein